MTYDAVIVGAGLYGAVVAQQLLERGMRVLVLEKRGHVGGNIYTENDHGIQVHVYGAHIFHTNDARVWDYVNRFAEFNSFVNSPKANYHGEIYSLPFTMRTFSELWNVSTPDEAKAIIEKQRADYLGGEPRNLEEQAISLVGTDIYEKLVKGYTEKQWGRECRDLPAFIIRRLPVRFNRDSNYFDAAYQGIPKDGYTAMTERMLAGAEVRTGTDYLRDRELYDAMTERVIYTGPVDAFYGYRYGPLQYRTVRFEREHPDTDDYQGNAVVNYTDRETPWTRIIEHKWFNFGLDAAGNPVHGTVISREYSYEWKPGDEPYYPVNNEENGALYNRYRELAEKEEKVLFGGRLGTYRYLDMDRVVAEALNAAETL